MLDAALLAEQRLSALSIKRLNDPSNLSKHFDEISGDIETRLRLKAIAVSIEEELQITPWVLTHSFNRAKSKGWQLALSGVADPSGCGEAHS